MLTAVAGLLVVSAPQQAEARPNYLKALTEKYKLADNEKVKEQKCGVCHGGEKGANKKVLSDYAGALKTALDLKKDDGGKVVPEKDVAKVQEALGKIEDQKDASGKTYGELLKAGELPSPAKAK
ncbi:hypothetical protein [Planctomicrobium sp. SH664]|uniref:hypothetical protein n=1 Tax=Planctomicrobium sp. SH664 TaxID=3448125 RepID=UPI003F5CB8ED